MSKPAALQRRLEYAGPALFSYGFRPFFLLAGLWAFISLPLWLHQFFGDISLPTHFAPLDWHIHEMLFGYVTAAIVGFLLTAIPNWTGRLPVCGWPLAGLAALWLAGRAAIFFSIKIGGAVAAVIDISFLLTITAVVAREIVAGKNWRNLRTLGALGVLTLGNAVFHGEVLLWGAANYGTRISVAAVILLISLIGGRIVPSFTHNWLSRNNPGRMPVAFSHFDMIVVAVGAVGLLAWIVEPVSRITGILLVFAGLLHLSRLVRWAGDRTLADRLVLVLHVAYAFIPIGFLLIGLSIFEAGILPSAGMHAWTAGAMGLMTLGVMTRATLGHTEQPLHAGIATQLIYALILVSAILRITASLIGSLDLIEGAAVCWLLGFALFIIAYGRLLMLHKPAWADARS